MRFLLIPLMSLLLCSCFQEDSKAYEYDKGYKSAWEGEEAPSGLFISKEEKEGYEQGSDDSAVYDDGYYDAQDHNSPKYLDDPDYMDGYKDGKTDE